MNGVMNLKVPQNAGNVACFLPGRAKDLSAPPYMAKFSVCSELYTKRIRTLR